MLQKVVKKTLLTGFSEVRENLSYWLSKSHEERIAAVEFLRRQHNGSRTRLQRSAHVTKRTQS